MMTRACPHCHALSHFTDRWSSDYYEDEYSDPQFMAFAQQCDNCGKPVCGVGPPEGAEDEEEYELIWPLVVAQVAFPDVPEVIAGAAREAHQALAAGASRASAAMARATVEATAKDKGITQGNLESKINRLASADHISEAMREAAHEIRFAGNAAAHGDILSEPISVADATEIVDLMDAILERVYQEPAKVERVRASREARRNRQEAAQVAE